MVISNKESNLILYQCNILDMPILFKQTYIKHFILRNNFIKFTFLLLKTLQRLFFLLQQTIKTIASFLFLQLLMPLLLLLLLLLLTYVHYHIKFYYRTQYVYLPLSFGDLFILLNCIKYDLK